VELEASNRYKSEFLANVSHELRTPLNSILLLSKMLAENPADTLTPEQVRQAKVIHDAGSDLRALIDNILDLSRVEARQMSLAAEPVNLRALVGHVVELMQPQLEEKSLQLRVEIDPAAPQEITSDGEKLRQILINFLSNAVKFTEQGGITISLKYTEDSTVNACPVSISVTDTGVGIEQDKHDLVFEAFKQADGSTSRRFGGTGLGLTISRELARLMGGRIDVRSQAGTGSTFTLLLPLEIPIEPAEMDEGDRASARVDKPEQTVIPVADYGGARVLLVDDDMRNLLAMTPLLEQWQLQVMAAGDGPEALETLESDGDFSLVFMDIMMPGMDGYETIRRIRKQERFRDLPVIALTARAGDEDLGMCLESGANDCVVKPVDPVEVKNLLDKYLLGRDGVQKQ
jgi:CheY-like chemotaxis protein